MALSRGRSRLALGWCGGDRFNSATAATDGGGRAAASSGADTGRGAPPMTYDVRPQHRVCARGVPRRPSRVGANLAADRVAWRKTLQLGHPPGWQPTPPTPPLALRRQTCAARPSTLTSTSRRDFACSGLWLCVCAASLLAKPTELEYYYLVTLVSAVCASDRT